MLIARSGSPRAGVKVRTALKVPYSMLSYAAYGKDRRDVFFPAVRPYAVLHKVSLSKVVITMHISTALEAYPRARNFLDPCFSYQIAVIVAL